MTWENDWYLKFPIAHRGLHSGDAIPENSLASFEACISKKIPIELDVHIMSDETILVFHDDNFERMTGYERGISTTTYDEIKDLRLGGSDEKAPTLEEVLTLVNGKVPIAIELKCFKHDGRLEGKVLSLLKNYTGHYSIQSFNPFTLLWFKRNAPNVIRGMLSGSFSGSRLNLGQKMILKSLVFVFLIRPHYIAFEWNKLWYPSVVFCRGILKIPVIAWCIKNKDQQQQASKSSQNIIFEDFRPF